MAAVLSEGCLALHVPLPSVMPTGSHATAAPLSRPAILLHLLVGPGLGRWYGQDWGWGSPAFFITGLPRGLIGQ